MPPFLITLGTVLPKVGRVFDRGGCKFMLQFLQQTVATRADNFETSIC
jgi:hypothetical protein